MAKDITTRSLLDLRPGSLIKATLKSGREVTVRVTKRPHLVASGKPGINRVRIETRDDSVKVPDHALFPTKGRHTIAGHRVIEIITAA